MADEKKIEATETVVEEAVVDEVKEDPTTIKDVADDVTEGAKKAASDVADDTKKVVDDVTTDTKKVVNKAVADTKKAAKKVASDAKKATKKLADDTKKATKKAASDAKKTVDDTKKAAAKKVMDSKCQISNLYFEYNGKQIHGKEILEQVEQKYLEEGHRLSSIKSINIYVKAEDDAAYYVINDKITGKLDI